MKKTTLILSSVLFLLCIYWQAQSEAASLGDMAAVNHSAYHIGLDLEAKPGEDITSPIQGEVSYTVSDVLTGASWAGIVIKGTGPDKDVTVRILGLASSLKPASKVKLNDKIGTAQDAQDTFVAIKPYVHLEVYKNGKLTNPAEFAKKRWSQKRVIDPRGQQDQRKQEVISDGLASEKAGQYTKAIESFQKAIKMPSWESVDVFAYHYLARSLASAGRYDDALKINDTLLDLLKMESECSPEVGKLPNPKLGVIAACRSKESTGILLFNLGHNSEAYKEKRPTVVNY